MTDFTKLGDRNICVEWTDEVIYGVYGQDDPSPLPQPILDAINRYREKDEYK